jgi:hypothetical protein
MSSIRKGRRHKKHANSPWNLRDGGSVRDRFSANDYVDDLGLFHDNDEVDAFLTRRDNEIERLDQKNYCNRKRKFHETNNSQNHPISTRTEPADKIVIGLQKLLYLREIGVFGQTAKHKCIIDKLSDGRGCKSSWKTLALRRPAPTPSATSFREIHSVRSGCGEAPIYNIHYFNGTQNKHTSANCDTDISTINDIPLHNLVWRTKQIIPFSKMKTPVSDAILAIDRSGGYLIGVGGEDVHLRKKGVRRDCPHPRLSLKFYGEICV